MIKDIEDPVSFCRQLLNDFTPQEFGQFIYALAIEGGDSLKFGMQLIIIITQMNKPYSAAAMWAYKELLDKDAAEALKEDSNA